MADVEARSFSVDVLVQAPLPPADVRSMSVDVLVSRSQVRQPGFYIKADDGNLYPMAQFPWTAD